MNSAKFKAQVSFKEIEKAIRNWQEIRFIYSGINNIAFWKADEPLLCRMHDGLPGELYRIKALGNAIVPQIAYLFFEAIKVIDEEKNKNL